MKPGSAVVTGMFNETNCLQLLEDRIFYIGSGIVSASRDLQIPQRHTLLHGTLISVVDKIGARQRAARPVSDEIDGEPHGDGACKLIG